MPRHRHARRGHGHGPPWSGQGSHRRGHGGPRWGLRRRLTLTFAFVALAAVGLTSWLTLGAVFQAQRELFGLEEPFRGPPWARFGAPREGPADPASPDAREAFGSVARTGFLAALLAFLLASVVAGAVTRRLTRPLLALERGARRLAAGERGLRLDVPRGEDELRSLTEAFNALVSGLERQEEWRRQVVADIAHDLRTPLSVLRAEVEAMQDGVRPRDDDGLDRLHRGVMRLSRLVEDLRVLSVAEAGGLGLRLQPVAVGPFLRELVGSFASRAEAAGVAFELAPVPAGLGVHADPTLLSRALSNLVDNALRYAAPGEVEVGAHEEGGAVRLHVRDHGPGLPAGEAERLFERFYRGDTARTRGVGGAEGGSGLGLSIAKALAEALGGRLEAADHPEGGAVFTLVLPVAEPHPNMP